MKTFESNVRVVLFEQNVTQNIRPKNRAGPRGVDYGGALKVERLDRVAQAASGGRV